MARKIEIEIVGDARKLEREFKRAGNAGSRLGRTMKSALKVGAIGAGVGLAGVALGARSAWRELVQAQKAAAQTEAVIKSTGGVANVSAKQIREMSAALLEKTGIDDEAIQSGANMLLTFKGVRNEAGKGNDIFNQATSAVLDMSTAMEGAGMEGANLKTTAIRIGKALNDPVRGMTALRRVGVTFTKDQEKMVKGMVASGRTMDAQKFILKELRSEFGGSAEAFGKTLPGQMTIFRERLKNVGADILGFFVPALTRGMDRIGEFADFLGKITGAGSFRVAIDVAVGGIKDFAGGIKREVEHAIRATDWRSVGQQLGAAISSGIQISADVLDRWLGVAMGWVHTHAGDIAELGAEIAVRMALTITDPAFWIKHTDLLLLALAVGFGRGIPGLVGKLGGMLGRLVGPMFSRLGGEAAFRFMSGVARLPSIIGDTFAAGATLAGRGIGLLWTTFRSTLGFMFRELGRIPGALGAAFKFAFVAAFFRLTLGALDKIMGALSTVLDTAGKMPGPLGAPFRAAARAVNDAR